MYALLTGLFPFYDLLETSDVQEKISNGETPPIDPRYFNKRSFAERKLAEIIELCWVYDADRRIDMFHVVDFLRNAVQENERRRVAHNNNTAPAE